MQTFKFFKIDKLFLPDIPDFQNMVYIKRFAESQNVTQI